MEQAKYRCDHYCERTSLAIHYSFFSGMSFPLNTIYLYLITVSRLSQMSPFVGSWFPPVILFILCSPTFINSGSLVNPRKGFLVDTYSVAYVRLCHVSVLDTTRMEVIVASMWRTAMSMKRYSLAHDEPLVKVSGKYHTFWR